MTTAGTLHGLFTISADRPFVDDLAAAILADADRDPLALARYRILLPTRRACRSLREAFLRLGDGRPALLPRMSPIGDVDEDDLILEIEGSLGAATPDIPPAISGLKRQLILTKLVNQRDPNASPEQCALLAQELARLIDQVATERLDFADLETLVEADYAEHWQHVLTFLHIVTENWPAILAEQGVLDPAERRNRLLEAQTALWQHEPPAGPVIAAGSTGSIPATADLLAVVAGLPTGAVVLPGLDRSLPDKAWQSLGEGHAQSGLARLLKCLGVSRDDVTDWPRPDNAGDIRQGRSAVLSRALMPAEAIDGPVTNDGIDEDALTGVMRIDCPNPVREAEVVALIMRETLETPNQTAALVSPDRQLARRVAAELQRWDIDVDDSAGQPLASTVPGVFMRLTASLLTDDFGPVPLLSVLKHPLAAGGIASASFRANARRLERAVLRGPRPAPGWDGLARDIDAGKPDLIEWVRGLADMTAPLSTVADNERASLRDLVRAHVETAEALSATDTELGAALLWSGDAGDALAAFFAELGEDAALLDDMRPQEYAALLETMMQGRVVRPRYGRHPRLNIWGPLEARLQHEALLGVHRPCL